MMHAVNFIVGNMQSFMAEPTSPRQIRHHEARKCILPSQNAAGKKAPTRAGKLLESVYDDTFHRPKKVALRKP